MLHLEALENRCLLSNNSGLFVLAVDDAPTTNLAVIDTVGNANDWVMNFGDLSAGLQSEPAYIYVTNTSAAKLDSITVPLISTDGKANFIITGYTIDGVTTAVDMSKDVNFSLNSGATAAFEVIYNPQARNVDIECNLNFVTSGETKLVSLYGHSTSMTENSFKASNLEVTNAFMAAALPNEIVAIDNPVQLELTLMNYSQNSISSKNLDVVYYLSTDDIVSADDVQIGSQNLGEVVSGASTISYSLTLPANTAQGKYNFIAVLDQGRDMFDVAQEIDSDAYQLYTGSIMVVDSVESYTDSNIDFGNVAIGTNSASEYVTLTNASNETITVSLDVLSSNFFLNYEKPEVLPAGYSDVISVDINQFSKYYMLNYGEESWAEFTLARPSIVTIYSYAMISSNTSSSNYDLEAFRVYNERGDVVVEMTDATSWTTEFIAPTAGTYYVEFAGMSDDIEVEVMVDPLIVPATDAAVEQTFTHIAYDKVYSVAVTEPSSFSAIMQPEITDRLKDYFAFYDVQVDSYVDIINNLELVNGNQDYDIYYTIPKTTFAVYNENGVQVTSFVYNFTAILNAYEAKYAQDIEENIDVTDPNAADMFVEEFNINLLQSGTYYFVYSYDTSYDSIITDPLDPADVGSYDFKASELATTFTYTGSSLELEPGESLDVPVIFSPTATDGYTGKLQITTVSGETTSVEIVDLQGIGVSGDLKINSGEIVADYPANLQSGSELRIQTVVTNTGMGRVLDGARLEYFIVGTDGVEIPVSLADGAASLDIVPYLATEYGLDSFMVGQNWLLSADLDIPAVAAGDYTVLVRLQQDDASVVFDATTDEFAFEAYFDAYSTLTIDSDGDLITPVAIDSLVAGGEIAYEISPLGSVTVGYVDVFNRGMQSITLDKIHLLDNGAANYTISLEKDAINLPSSAVEVKSGQYQRVYVNFNPQSYDDLGSAQLDGMLTIITSDDIRYNVSLNGGVFGGDLVVYESTGQANDDDVIVMPDSRLGIASTTVITLANRGSEDLIVSGFEFVDNSPFSADVSGTILLSAGQTREVTVSFAPSVVGYKSQEFVIYSTDPANDNRYALTIQGTGVAPAVEVKETSGKENDNSLVFGNQAPIRATQTTELVSLINGLNANGQVKEGVDVYKINNVTIGSYQGNEFVASNAFELMVVKGDGSQVSVADYLAENGGVITLGVGGELDFSVDFVATTIGSYSGILLVDSVDGDIEIFVGGSVFTPEYLLKDNATGKPVTGEIDMGEVVVSKGISAMDLKEVRVLTFNVEGKSAVRVDNVSVTGAGYSLLSVSGDNQEQVVAPGNKIYVTVQFDAGALTDGQYDGTLVIDGSYDASYDLTATVLEPDVNVASSLVSFGNTLMGQSVVKYLTVNNTGNAPLVITGFACADNQFSLVDDIVTIAAGASAQVGIAYQPSTLNSSTADFVLLTNDMDESAVTVTVTGMSGGNILTPSKISGNSYYYIFNNAQGDRVKLTIKYVTDVVATAKSVAVAPVVYLDSVWDAGNISRIEMPGSTAASSITISGDIVIGDIVAGSLAAIKAPAADLNGDVVISGTISSIRLDDILAESSVSVADGKNIGKAMTIVVDSIAENTDFNLTNMYVKTFQATSYASGELHAQNIGNMTIKNGSLGAAVTSYDDIRSINVKNDILANVLAYDSIGSLKAGGSIGSESLIMAGNTDLAQSAKTALTTGSIKSVSVGGDINGDIYALNGQIGQILASRGDINGGIFAESLRSISARNMAGVTMAIDNTIGRFQVKYDIVDSVIGVGYDFSSLASTGYNAGTVGTIVNSASPAAKAVGSYKIGGDYQGNNIISFL